MRWKYGHGDVPVDPKTSRNDRLVNWYKIQCRVITSIILHLTKDHISDNRHHVQVFLCVQEAIQLNMLWHAWSIVWRIYTPRNVERMLTVVKPDVIINVKDLDQKIMTIVILKVDNNFSTLVTKMEELQQEINVLKRDEYFKDDHYHTWLDSSMSPRQPKVRSLEVFGSPAKIQIRVQWSMILKTSTKTWLLKDLRWKWVTNMWRREKNWFCHFFVVTFASKPTVFCNKKTLFFVSWQFKKMEVPTPRHECLTRGANMNESPESSSSRPAL